MVTGPFCTKRILKNRKIFLKTFNFLSITNDIIENDENNNCMLLKMEEIRREYIAVRLKEGIHMMWELEGLGLNRIEKIARVSASDNDTANSFKRSQQETKDNAMFHNMLTKAIRSRERAETAEIKVSDPYAMDCARMTHSLFYRDGLKLNILPKSVLGAYG